MNLKAGYTLLTLIFGYLSDTKRCNIEEKWTERLVEKCNRQKYRANVVAKERAIKQAWTIITLVREPINRFLSAWLDRCIHRRRKTKTDYCAKCRGDLGCFVKTHYKILTSYANKKKSLAASFDGGHFWPQTWECPLDQKLSVAVVKFGRTEQFFSTLESVLSGHSVNPQRLKRLMNRVRHQTTAHKTFGGQEWANAVTAMKKDPEIYETLIKILYFDYEEYGQFQIQPTLNCWLQNNEEITDKAFLQDLLTK